MLYPTRTLKALNTSDHTVDATDEWKRAHTLLCALITMLEWADPIEFALIEGYGVDEMAVIEFNRQVLAGIYTYLEENQSHIEAMNGVKVTAQSAALFLAAQDEAYYAEFQKLLEEERVEWKRQKEREMLEDSLGDLDDHPF